MNYKKKIYKLRFTGLFMTILSIVCGPYAANTAMYLLKSAETKAFFVMRASTLKLFITGRTSDNSCLFMRKQTMLPPKIKLQLDMIFDPWLM